MASRNPLILTLWMPLIAVVFAASGCDCPFFPTSIASCESCDEPAECIACCNSAATSPGDLDECKSNCPPASLARSTWIEQEIIVTDAQMVAQVTSGEVDNGTVLRQPLGSNQLRVVTTELEAIHTDAEVSETWYEPPYADHNELTDCIDQAGPGNSQNPYSVCGAGFDLNRDAFVDTRDYAAYQRAEGMYCPVFVGGGAAYIFNTLMQELGDRIDQPNGTSFHAMCFSRWIFLVEDGSAFVDELDAMTPAQWDQLRAAFDGGVTGTPLDFQAAIDVRCQAMTARVQAINAAGGNQPLPTEGACFNSLVYDLLNLARYYQENGWPDYEN